MSLGIEQDLRRKRLNPWVDFVVRIFREKPLSAVGLVIVSLLLLMAVTAQWIAPHDYREQVLDEALLGHSLDHPLGTDQIGRDQLSRIIVGAQVSMIVGFSCVAGFLIVAIVIGMGSGYVGGAADIIVQRIVDGWMTIPTLILLLAMVAVVGQGMWQIIFILSIDRGISTSRVLRGEALYLKESTYVEAARALGAGNLRIFLVHIIPNAFASIIVMATISPRRVHPGRGVSQLPGLRHTAAVPDVGINAQRLGPGLHGSRPVDSHLARSGADPCGLGVQHARRRNARPPRPQAAGQRVGFGIGVRI